MRRKIHDISVILSVLLYIILAQSAFAYAENPSLSKPEALLIAQVDDEDSDLYDDIMPSSETGEHPTATPEVKLATGEETITAPVTDESKTTEPDEIEPTDEDDEISPEPDEENEYADEEEHEYADDEGEDEHATDEEDTHAAAGHTSSDAHGGGHGSGWQPPLWSVIGFVGMLLSIAVIPLINEKWWEPNLHKGYVVMIFGIPLFILLAIKAPGNLKHELIEYVSFMALLGSLFYISGGIFLQGDIEATPRNNTLFIAAGTLMASLVGTTGAAMLLIRPLLRTNGERERKMHTVIFFIFLACNIGGSLTPMGDPPLFMGYLRGVPFTWTLNLWIQWLPMSILLLIIYYFLDSYHYKREKPEFIAWDKRQILPLKLMGNINFLWLIGVVAAIYFLTPTNLTEWFGESWSHAPLREISMVLLILISWKTTPHGVREAQSFSLHPIIEVAVLFLGIFVTMVPALMLLEINGPAMGVTKPWQFFWFTGILSSFLDNTPTYLVFFELAKTISHGPDLVAGITYEILLAISVGAVFMGANTYIGNGPNFMVKAIAEENSVKMPSFFGYMLWSFGILVPLFVIMTFIYFL